MSVVNIPTSASGYHQSIVSQAVSAQRVVNKMQMSPKLNPKGFVQPLGRITNSASEFQKSMDASAARVFAFGAAVGVINGISNAFSDMVRSAVEVEKSLKDIQVVMEATNREMAKFGQGLFDVAKNTATSFETVSKSAVELARQGLGAAETLDRVNSALILSRLSGLDAVKSTETLTAAINSFNKEGITHEQIVNRMANVDAAFAVSSKDLAEAISRAGAVAQSSGVSFNELASIVTAVQQRTARGGSVIGNGFKSIFTRIKRSGVRDALNAIGVATDDLNGNFRSGISILKDYAKVYKTLSDAQKAYTSEQIAGVFQIQNLQALIQDLGDETSIYERALSTANNTTNEAISRNAELNKTLSAIFNQTSMSVKELGARLAELAVTDSFKTLLNSVTKFAEWMTKLLDEDAGSDFAKNIVKGFGRFLTGPGTLLIGAAFIKIFVLVTKFAKEAFSDILGMNREAKRQQTLQSAIGSVLSSNSNVYQKILAASGNTAKQEQIILNIIKQETAERLRQEALVKRIAASSAMTGIGAGERGFTPMGKRGARKIGKKTLGMAQGFLPAINREHRAIRNNVGGARRGDRPVVLKNHSMGRGRRQNVVAHTGEWKVPNFRGSGGTAIFNRAMVKRFGMPRGAKRITAADGFVPNFASGTKAASRREEARATELGWKAGGASPISKFSDSMDRFIGMINISRLSKGAREIGNKAHGIIAGKRSTVDAKDIPFGNNSIFGKEIGTGKNAGKERYIINPKFKNISGVRQKFLKNGIHSSLLKDGNGKGTLTSIESLTKRWIDPKNKKDIKWKDGQFQNIVGGIKGVWAESEAKRYLRGRREKFGLSGGDKPKSLSGNKFFDLIAGKQYFEVKGKRRTNPLEVLKKAASLYLSNPKVNHKNNIAEKIDLGASKLFEKGINLIMAKDTQLSRETINAAGGLSPTFKVKRNGEIVDTGIEINKNRFGYLSREGQLKSKDQSFKFNKDDLIEGGGKNRWDQYTGGETGTVKSKHLKAVYGNDLNSAELKDRQKSDERTVARKRSTPTIDARAIATMIIPNEGYRKQHNGIYDRKIKVGKKERTEKTRLKWNIEGIKRAGVEVSAEEKIRKQAEKIYPAFVNRAARQLIGPELAPGLKPSEYTEEARKHTSVLAGHVFESALKSIDKNTEFTHDSANFDIVGNPEKELRKLFGYNTYYADAKIGDTKDTKASFAKKIFKLGMSKPSSIGLENWEAQMAKNEKAGFKIDKGSGEAYGWKAAEGRIGRLKKLLPGYKPQNASEGFIPNMSEGFIPNMSEGFIPNFTSRIKKRRGSKTKATFAAADASRLKKVQKEQERNEQINLWLKERGIRKNSPEGKAYKANKGRLYYEHISNTTSGGLPFAGTINPSAKFRVRPTVLDPVSKFVSNKVANVSRLGRVGVGMGAIAGTEARSNSQKIASLEARITALESKASSKIDPWAAAYKEDSRYNYNGASGYIPNYAEGWGWVQEILDKEVREQSAVGNKWRDLMIGGDKVQAQDKYRVSVDNKTGNVTYADSKNSTINDPVGSRRGRTAILSNPDIQKTILDKFNSRLLQIQSYNEGGGKMLRNFGSKIFGKDLIKRLTLDPQKQQQKEMFNRFLERVRNSGIQNNPGLHIGTGGRSIFSLSSNPVVQLKESGLRSILEGKGADSRGIPSGVKNSMVMDDFIRGMIMSSVSQGPNAGAASTKRLSGMSGLLGGLSKLGIGQLGERFFRLVDSAKQYPGTKIAELYNWNSMRKEERAKVQKEKQRMFAEQKKIKSNAQAELAETRKLNKLWIEGHQKREIVGPGEFAKIKAHYPNWEGRYSPFTLKKLKRFVYLNGRVEKNKQAVGMIGRGLHVFKDAAGKPITWAKGMKHKAGQTIQDLIWSGKKGLGMMGTSAKDFFYHYGAGQADGMDRYQRGAERLLESGTSKVATSSVEETLEKKERKKSRRGRTLRYLVKKSYKKIRDKFLFPERHSDPLVKGGSIGPMFKVFDSMSSLWGRAKGGVKAAGVDPLVSGKGAMFKLFDFIDKVRSRPDANRTGSEGIFSRFKNELINLTNEGARKGERVGDSPKGASKAGAPGMGPQIGLVFHNLLESLKNHARPAGESMSNWWKSFSTGRKFGVSKNKSDKGYAPKRSVLKRLVSGISGAIPDLKFPSMNAKSIFGKLKDKGFLTRKEAVDLENQHQSPRQSSSQQRPSKKVNRKKSRKQTKRLENQTGYQPPQRDPLKFGMYEKVSEFLSRRKNEGKRLWDWGSDKSLAAAALGKQLLVTGAKNTLGFASKNKGKLALGASALSMLGLKSSSSGLGATLASKLGITGTSGATGGSVATGVGGGTVGAGGGKSILGFLSAIDLTTGLATAGAGAASIGAAAWFWNKYKGASSGGPGRSMGTTELDRYLEKTVKYRGQEMSMRDAMKAYLDPKLTWRDYLPGGGARRDMLKMPKANHGSWETREKNMMQHFRRHKFEMGRERLYRQLVMGYDILPFDPIYSQEKDFIRESRENIEEKKKTPKGRKELAKIVQDYEEKQLKKDRIRHTHKRAFGRRGFIAGGRAGGFIPNFRIFGPGSGARRVSMNKNFTKLGSGVEGTAFRRNSSNWGIKVGHEPVLSGININQQIARKRIHEQRIAAERRSPDMARLFNKMNKNGPMFAPKMKYGWSRTAGQNVTNFQFIKGKSLDDLVRTGKLKKDDQRNLLNLLEKDFIRKSKRGQGSYLPKLDTNASNFIIPDNKVKGFLKYIKSKNFKEGERYKSIKGLPKNSVAVIDLLERNMMKGFANGFIPSFADPLLDSYNREKIALRDRGIPSSAIRLERSSKLVDNNLNPGGWAFTNRVDERLGINQGIDRSLSMGINPKTHGMNEGFIPNFRFGFLKPRIGNIPGFRKPQMPKPANIPARPKQGPRESDQAFAKRERLWKDKKDVELRKYDEKMKTYDRQAQKVETRTQGATMGAMLLGPQIAQMISAGDSAEDRLRGGAGSAMMEQGAMGASYGSMLGPKGMLYGALGGAVYGAASYFGNEDRNKRTVSLGGELRVQKEKLDKVLNNVNGIKGYTEGVRGLNEAMSEGDPLKVRAFQKQMVDSLSSLTDVKLINSLSEVGNGTLSFSDKIDALGGILKQTEAQALKTKAALELQTNIMANHEKGAGWAGNAWGATKDFLLNNPITSGFQSIYSAATGQRKDVSVTGDGVMDSLVGSFMSRSGGLARSLREGVYTEERAKDFASRGSSFFKQSSLVDAESLAREAFLRTKKSNPNFTTSFKDFKDQNLDSFNILASQETAKNMKDSLDELEGFRNEFLRMTYHSSNPGATTLKELRDIKTFEDLEDFNAKRKDKNPLSIGNVAGGADGEIMQRFKEDMKNSDFFKSLSESNGAEAAAELLDKMTDGGEFTSTESGLSNFSLWTENIEMMKKQLESQRKLTDALVENSDASAANLKRQKDIYEEIQSLVIQVRDITRASEDFKLNNDLAESVMEIRQETNSSRMRSTNEIMRSVGMITDRELISRSAAIKSSNADFSSGKELRSKMLGTLMANMDPSSIINMESLLKKHNLPEEKKSGGYIKRAQDKLSTDERKDREYFTKSFLEFMSQNADGNTTLVEIKDFIGRLNGTSGYIARIQQETKAHQARSNILLRETNKQLRSEKRQELLRLDAALVNKLGSKLISSEETRGISDAIYTGGLLPDGQRSRFVNSKRGGSVTAKESDALNATSQLFLEDKYGLSLSGITGRSRFDSMEKIVERNIEKAEKESGRDAAPFIDLMKKDSKRAFANLRSANNINNQRLGALGYSGDLSEQGKIVAANVTTADQITKFYGLANGAGINISQESINAIGSSFLAGLGSDPSGGDSSSLTGSITDAQATVVNHELEQERKDIEAKRKKEVVLPAVKRGSETIDELSEPFRAATARNKATDSLTYGDKSLNQWAKGKGEADPEQLELLKERLKKATLRYDKYEDFDPNYEWVSLFNRYYKGEKQRDGSIKWDDAPATEESPLWTPTKEEGGVFFGEDTLPQAFEAWKAKTSPNSNKTDSGLALAQYKIKFPKSIKNPKIIGGSREDLAENQKIINKDKDRAFFLEKIQTKEGRKGSKVRGELIKLAKRNIYEREASFYGDYFNPNQLDKSMTDAKLVEEVAKILHKLDPEGKFESMVIQNEDGTTKRFKHHGQPRVSSDHRREAGQIVDSTRAATKNLVGQEGLDSFLQHVGKTDRHGNNISRDDDTIIQLEEITEELQESLRNFYIYTEEKKRLEKEGKTVIEGLRGGALASRPVVPGVFTVGQSGLSALPESDPFAPGFQNTGGERSVPTIESNRGITVDSSDLVNSINELPKRLSEEMNSFVFNHVVNGNVTLDFNTEMFSQALGPVMFENLKKMIVDPVIASVMAKAVEGIVRISPDQLT